MRLCFLPVFSPLRIMKTYVGIDVSKDTLTVAFPTTPDTWKVSSFANSPDGIRRLKNVLPSEAHVVIEATGSYSVLLTYMLCQAKICLSVINPKQIGPPRVILSYYHDMDR